MNKGLIMMLKALGVEITPEQIAMIQAIIPQIPGKINEAAEIINRTLQNFDARLRAIETELKEIRKGTAYEYTGGSDTRPGNGESTVAVIGPGTNGGTN